MEGESGWLVVDEMVLRVRLVNNHEGSDTEVRALVEGN